MKKSIFTILIVVFLFSTVLPANALVPNDSEYSKQQSMWNSVNAPAAWDITTGSRRVIVAVIDTGVDTWHPDLSANIWANPFEIEGNNYDDDHNGYIDDVHGWNFIEKNSDVRTSVFNEKDVTEAVRHGTLAAGLIGAMGNNGKDGVGVNWQVSIMPLRAVASNGYGSMSDVTEAVIYAINNGADVISMSMVSDYPDSSLQAALRAAYEQGVVVVASAGNSRSDLTVRPHYPVCYDRVSDENWVIGVGALISSTPDKLADFSDYGSCVDFVAPGSGVYSAERYAPQYGYDESFGGPWDGTSFSAPIVAGTVALLKSIHPEWRPDKILSVLQTTADNVDSANPGLYGKIGAGKINIGSAVDRASRETSFRGVDLTKLYYVSNDKNKIVRMDLTQGYSYVLANTEEAEIVDLARLGNRPGGREYLAALLRRDNFYYVGFFDDYGRRLREISLNSIGDKTAVPQKIVWRDEYLTAGYTNSKTKTSYLVDYDLNGASLRQIELKNLIDWESEPVSGYLAVVIPNKKDFKWQLYDNNNQIVSSGLWQGYSSMADLRVGYFWGESSLQVGAMLKNSKGTLWQMNDTKSNKVISEQFSTKFSDYAAIPGLYWGRPAFVIYAAGDNNFSIHDGRAQLLRMGEF